ncbi:hypothetical protein Scep_003858 [Stephania cephalantha]|uniref:Uncharacterized protein n=1 Tax=Stephania cephalantha TaxID=152367 RepID=A0AAP0PWQ6_9MAGN
MARGGRRREDREKREVSVRKKMMMREVVTWVKRREKRSGKRGRERTELHGEEGDGSPKPGRTGPGSEPKEDRKGKES